MTAYSVFVANGDSCGICLALDGHRVPAGHKPHSSCTCETIVVHDDGDCTWSFDFEGYGPSGTVGGSVTVKCPDGSEMAESFEVPVPGYSPSPGAPDPEAEALLDAAEDHAQELCSQCQHDDDADAGFRCC